MVTRDLDEEQCTRWSFTGPSATLHLSPWLEPSTLASSLISADPARVETDASITREVSRRAAARKDDGAAPRPLPASRAEEVPPQLRAILGLMEEAEEQDGPPQPAGRGQLPAAIQPSVPAAQQPVASMRPPVSRSTSFPPAQSSVQAMRGVAQRPRAANAATQGAQLARTVVFVMIVIYVLVGIFGS